MKKYIYLALILLFFGCKKSDKNDPDPQDLDVSGNYSGVIDMRDLIGVPTPNSTKTSQDTLEISVAKNGENYIIHGFDTVDLTIPVSQKKAYTIPVDLNTPRVLSALVSFSGDSLRIQGNWRYAYIEGEYNSSSINTRNYIFVGHKKP